jgi:hypothetical protein
MPVRAAIGVAVLALSIVSLWGQLAISALAIDGSGTPRATQRLLPAIGVYLLLLLAVALALGVPFGIWIGVSHPQVLQAMAEGAGPATGDPAAAGSLLMPALAGIAALIALLFVLARLAPLAGVILTERRGIGAIGRAWRLTRGMTWKLVGVVLLYAVTSWVAQKAAQMVVGSVMAIVAGGEGPITLGGIVTAIVVGAIATAFSVLAAVFTAKLYVATADAAAARMAAVEPLA